MKHVLYLLLWSLPLSAVVGAGFDHEHRLWTTLLQRHVVLTDQGKASQMRYADFKKDRAQLRAYLDTLSSVTQEEFNTWNEDQRLAFLINAYNALTVELILTRYPNLKSIRDFGRFFASSWRRRLFVLLGKQQHLDGIEHEIIRAPGVYDEPRIHMAVNCASIGCPMLREEAYIAHKVEVQLEEQVVRFMSDRTRNRFDPEQQSLAVSEIFDWYGEDFSNGYNGIQSRQQFFAKYADPLTDDATEQKLIREHKANIDFLEYDWGLNDYKG